MRSIFHLLYRQTEGVIKATGKSLPSHPSYGHICKRINKLNVGINNGIKRDNDNYIIIAVDFTGIKVTNCGQWMADKWGSKKKGYLKIHIAVNIKTKEIIALEITEDKVHDNKILKKMVNQVLDNSDDDDENKIKIKSVLVDGVHDTNKNFQYLEYKRESLRE
jgi:hypothetical protein